MNGNDRSILPVLLCGAVVVLFFIFPVASIAFQYEEGVPEERASAGPVPGRSAETPGMVVALVEEACRLMEEMGEASVDALMMKNGRFRFGDIYVWVHDLEANRILAHPVLSRAEGVNFIYLRDITGKLCFSEFNQVAIEKGSGWVEYYWPRPREIEPILKTTYVKLCRHAGKRYVVACGIYGLSKKGVKDFFADREGKQPESSDCGIDTRR